MTDLTMPFELRFFIALGLSFLIGLERERSGMITKGRVFAGVRTYSLIGVFGFGCAWLYRVNVVWILPIGLISMTALALVGYLAKLKQGHVGWTSEVAALLTFIIGALCLLGEIWVPLALGIIATFLLSEKSQIEHYVESLDKAEFLAVIKFLLVTLIILPVLPNTPYTQFNLNPRHIWQIVVLVSSIGFAGYFLSKKFGDKIGLWLSGILGGIVSSTAVSITTGRVAQKSPEQSGNALRAAILASSVMYLRILALIWFIKPDFVPHIWAKLVILSVIGIGFSLFIPHHNGSPDKPVVKAPSNPFEIKPALIFASLFVILTVITVMIQKLYGDSGLLVLAGITGVSDIDPFILSLINNAADFQKILISAIIISMMSNTVMKGIYFGYLAREVRFQVAWRHGLWALLHLPVILIG